MPEDGTAPREAVEQPTAVEGEEEPQPKPLARKGGPEGTVEDSSLGKQAKRVKLTPRIAFRLATSAKEKSVPLRGVRDLVLHLTANTHLTGIIGVANKKFLGHVCVVHVPGLSSKAYEEHREHMPFISGAVSFVVPVVTEAKKVAPHKLLIEMLYQNLLPKGKPKVPAQGQAAADTQACTAESLLLTEAQLAANDFPALNAQQEPPPGYRVTAEVDGAPDVVAVDCEMCVTAEGYELTRCAVIGLNGEVLYNEYVKPHNPILDYKTQYSGVTEGHLKDVTRRLEDVQNALLSLISSSTIVVGHALHNDLRALRLVHRRVVDTALLYPHRNGLPERSALRYIAHKLLHKSVQGYQVDLYVNPGASAEGGDAPPTPLGHSPVEDAQTCIELLQLKLRYGPDFGIEDGTLEHIFEVIHRAQSHTPVAVAETPTLLRFFPEHSRRPADDEEGWQRQVTEALAQAPNCFVWTQLRAVLSQHEMLYGEAPAPDAKKWFKTRLCLAFQSTGSCRLGDKCGFAHGEEELRSKSKPIDKATTDSAADAPSDGAAPTTPAADAFSAALPPILQKVDAAVRSLWEAAPHNTAFVVYCTPPPEVPGALPGRGPAKRTESPLFLFAKYIASPKPVASPQDTVHVG